MSTLLVGTAPPTSGTGVVGNFFFDSVATVLYGPKPAQGVWPAGWPLGKGTDLLHGVVDPGPGDGSEGDFWINTTSDFLFGPKAAGVWPAGVSLVGPVGPVGPMGPVGPGGVVGPMGPAGADGKTVLNGAGAPGPGDGVDGDFWLDTVTSDLYGPKAGGIWPAGVSLIGPMGPMGPAGADGQTVLNGAGAPGGGLGVDGDFYIDTAADFLYGPKAGGVWPAGVSLVGPATGAAGGDLTGNYPAPELVATGPGVTGPFGSATTVPIITIDAKGRVTGLTSTTVSGVVPSAHAASHAVGGSDPFVGPLALQAGTIVAGTAPLKLASGPLLTVSEVGAVEFLTDQPYWTITTGTSRKPLVLADAALTTGRVPFTTTNGRLADSANWTRNATTGQITQTYNSPGVATVYQLVNTNATANSQVYTQYVVDGGSCYFGAESLAGSLSPGGSFIYNSAARPFSLWTNGTKRWEVSGAGALTSSAVSNTFVAYGKFGSTYVGANTLLAAGNVTGSFGGSDAAIHFTDNSLSATVNFQNTNASGYTAFDFFNSAGTKSATFAWGNASAGFPNVLWISTRTATDMWFGTNTAERLRITAAGKVGISQAAPFCALTNSATDVSDSGSGAGTHATGFIWKTAAIGWAAAINNTDATANLRNGLLVKIASTNSLNKAFEVDTGSAVRFCVTGEGKVGFGTHLPICLLSNSTTNNIDVDGNGTILSSGFVWNGNGAGYVASYYNADANNGVRNGLFIGIAGAYAANKLLEFESAGVMRMRVTGDGSIYMPILTPGQPVFATTAGLLTSSPPYAAKTANYTLAATDRTIRADATGGSFALTLPTAVGHNREYYIKCISSVNTLTVNTTSSQLIDNVTSLTLAQYDCLHVQSDGANWMVL